MNKVLLLSIVITLLSACVPSSATTQFAITQTQIASPSTTTAPAFQTAVSTTTVESTFQPGNWERKLSVNGLERSYFLYVPTSPVSLQNLPVVFIFSGYHMTSARMRDLGLDHIADQNDFLAVYPNGFKLSWNAGGCCGPAAKENVDDIEFIRQILSDLKTFASIDLKRIYATGFSNGAMFTYRLACEMSDTFAAIAPLSGALMYSPCQPQQPVSVMHVHGLADLVVPYSGGLGSASVRTITFPPVKQSIAEWVNLDGCTGTAQKEKQGRVYETIYSSCRSGSAVELYTISELVHDWPPMDVMPIPNIIWEFFSAHPKP